MALRGMLSNFADAGSCASTSPAFSLMARAPCVPSEPMPESSTPMLDPCRSSARERKKKSIGRRRPRGAVGSKRCSLPCRMRHVLVGRDHVDAVRLDLHPVPDLRDLHRGEALEQLGHDPLVRRVQVLDDDEGQAAAVRHVPEELLQRLQPAGRGADADDRAGPGVAVSCAPPGPRLPFGAPAGPGRSGVAILRSPLRGPIGLPSPSRDWRHGCRKSRVARHLRRLYPLQGSEVKADGRPR